MTTPTKDRYVPAHRRKRRTSKQTRQARYQATYRAKLISRGYEEITVVIPRKAADLLKIFRDEMRPGEVIEAALGDEGAMRKILLSLREASR
jgi:hypothetical protein